MFIVLIKKIKGLVNLPLYFLKEKCTKLESMLKGHLAYLIYIYYFVVLIDPVESLTCSAINHA